MRYIHLVLLIPLAVQGCVPLTAVKGVDRGQLFDRDGVDTIAASGGARMVFFKKTSSDERFCLAPGPDVSEAASEDLNIQALGRTVKASEGETDVLLGGRSPTVLIIRELMYRACEASINAGASAEDTRTTYLQFLTAVRDLPVTPGTPASQPASAGIQGR